MIGLIMLSAALTVDLDAVKTIESHGDPRAYNVSSGARGHYQITKICLDDYNNYHKDKQYTMDDVWDPKVNKRIAAWYLMARIPQMLDHYGILITTDSILHAYNAGIGRVIEGIMPAETKEYIRRYHAVVGD